MKLQLSTGSNRVRKGIINAKRWIPTCFDGVTGCSVICRQETCVFNGFMCLYRAFHIHIVIAIVCQQFVRLICIDMYLYLQAYWEDKRDQVFAAEHADVRCEFSCVESRWADQTVNTPTSLIWLRPSVECRQLGPTYDATSVAFHADSLDIGIEPCMLPRRRALNSVFSNTKCVVGNCECVIGIYLMCSRF